MTSLAEKKAGVRSFVLREVAGRVIPPLTLEVVDSPSFEQARELDQKGEWEGASHLFYSLYRQETDPKLRAEAGVGLSQMLINLARFGQAREWLNEVACEATPEIKDENERRYYQARRKEKLAWIADHEGDFKKEIERLEEAKWLIREIPEEERGEKEEELLSTATHFLGRANFGLGIRLKGEEKEMRIGEAITYFEDDLSRYQQLREEGKPRPAGEGFNHAWLARCHIELSRESKAEEEVELAGRLFREHTQLQRESGIMAHYYLLQGRLAAKRGKAREAREHFEEALRIRTEVEPYPKGEGDAAMGIAWTYLAEGKLMPAGAYAMHALRKYPQFLLRGFF